jgi:hypothetical protein
MTMQVGRLSPQCQPDLMILLMVRIVEPIVTAPTHPVSPLAPHINQSSTLNDRFEEGYT